MKVQNPLTGRSSGKFSNAIFQTWKGINVVRSLPLEVANPRTLPQTQARNKLSLASKTAARAGIIHRRTLKDVAVKKTTHNVAVERIIEKTDLVSGSETQMEVKSRVRLANNVLELPFTVTPSGVTAGNQVTFALNRALAAEEVASLECFYGGFPEGNTLGNFYQHTLTESDEIVIELTDWQTDTTILVFYEPSSGNSRQIAITV